MVPDAWCAELSRFAWRAVGCGTLWVRGLTRCAHAGASANIPAALGVSLAWFMHSSGAGWAVEVSLAARIGLSVR